jgi:hypothetical protein
MTRYKATPEGNVPFTPEEEAEWDAMEAEYAAGADDRAAAKVRKERDEKLAATDWRASVDLTLSTEWANYRQALRDVPSQAGFPNTITWPSEPE